MMTFADDVVAQMAERERERDETAEKIHDRLKDLRVLRDTSVDGLIIVYKQIAKDQEGEGFAVESERMQFYSTVVKATQENLLSLCTLIDHLANDLERL